MSCWSWPYSQACLGIPERAYTVCVSHDEPPSAAWGASCSLYDSTWPSTRPFSEMQLLSLLCRELLEGASELRFMLCRDKFQGTKRGTSVIAACGAESSGVIWWRCILCASTTRIMALCML